MLSVGREGVPSSESAQRPPGPRLLAGGVVAYNDERRIGPAIDSLLSQELPAGSAWSRIWVVASGCSDRTVEVANSIAQKDPRVSVLVEPERRGKAAAVQEVLGRAEGSHLVLLNSDAVAEPGAVAGLLRAAGGRRAPYAVMGRPVVPGEPDDEWIATMRWMWELHHELHATLLAGGSGAHLSDELLLVSLPVPFRLEERVINDGSYVAVWLTQHQGSCWYAPESRVRIEVPRTVSDHLWQRRRIHVGNAQVRRLLGQPPTTLPRLWLSEPVRAARVLRTMVLRPGGLRRFARVAYWELVAHGLATWDRAPPARDHVRWRRIRPADDDPTDPSMAPDRTGADAVQGVHDRVRSLLNVARDFSTGVSLEHLVQLLPATGPSTISDLERWLSVRPDLARVDSGWAFAPTAHPASALRRTQRGEDYRKRAQELLDGPLSVVRRWIRCIGLTGSTAYGEPEPGDDLDFFVVTRHGSLWVFLAVTYLALRLRRADGPPTGRPVPCFNYVLEDSLAPSEFEGAGGFLFARESLAVRTLLGDGYYRGLLGRARWIGEWIPRLYSERTRTPGECRPNPAPLPVRALNLLVFPLLATYLQLAGLRRGARDRRLRGERGEFYTVTRLRRLAFLSRRFEQIRRRYEPDLIAAGSSESMTVRSRSFPSR